MSRHTVGSVAIASLALVWGVIGIVVREVDLPAMVIVFFRVALSAAVVACALVVIGRRAWLRPPRAGVFAAGVALAVHWSLYFAAIQRTSVASAVLITYAAPIFMALLARVVLDERVPRRSVMALAVSVAGVLLISLSGGSAGAEVRPVGVVLALGAAVSYAVLIILVKRVAADVEPVTIVLYQSLTAAVVLLPAALIADYTLTAAQFGYLALLGVGLTGISGVIYISALRWVPATTAGILSYMEPVSAAVLAAVVLGERLTWGIAVGGAMIVGAGVSVALNSPEDAMGSVEEPVRLPAATGHANLRG